MRGAHAKIVFAERALEDDFAVGAGRDADAVRVVDQPKDGL
jgi:hypothetical protein